MIIDCNATLGHWPFRRLRDSEPEEFTELMDELGIAQAWVSPFEAIFYKLVNEANEDFALALAGLHDRLVQFPVINPAFPGWEDDLAEWLTWPLPGFRLYPSYHGYALDDEACVEILERVGQASCLSVVAPPASKDACPTRVPLIQIVVRVQDERHHHPLAMVKPVDLSPLPALAARFAGLRFIVLNANPGEVPVAGGCPANVFLDISHVEGLGGVATLARSIGVSQVLFGTHAPYLYPESAFLKMQEAELTEEEREAILHGNAARLFETGG